jgi:putative transposase
VRLLIVSSGCRPAQHSQCLEKLEISYDNGEKVRVAFALDCCDREALGHVATTSGITAEDVPDLMAATVEHRSGRVNRVSEPTERLTDNGSWAPTSTCRWR